MAPVNHSPARNKKTTTALVEGIVPIHINIVIVSSINSSVQYTWGKVLKIICTADYRSHIVTDGTVSSLNYRPRMHARSDRGVMERQRFGRID